MLVNDELKVKTGISLSMENPLCNPYIQGTTVPCDNGQTTFCNNGYNNVIMTIMLLCIIIHVLLYTAPLLHAGHHDTPLPPL